jgi:hypothetical protein
MSARLKVWGDELAAVFVRGYLRFSRIAYEFGRCVCYRNGDEQAIMRHKVARAVTTNSQGRQMLQNNREHLELERIMSEIRKLAAGEKKHRGRKS